MTHQAGEIAILPAPGCHPLGRRAENDLLDVRPTRPPPHHFSAHMPPHSILFTMSSRIKLNTDIASQKSFRVKGSSASPGPKILPPQNFCAVIRDRDGGQFLAPPRYLMPPRVHTQRQHQSQPGSESNPCVEPGAGAANPAQHKFFPALRGIAGQDGGVTPAITRPCSESSLLPAARTSPVSCLRHGPI